VQKRYLVKSHELQLPSERLKYEPRRNLVLAILRTRSRRQKMLLRPESPLAQAYEPSLGERRGFYGVRSRVPAAVVIHTTGSGPVQRVSASRFAAWRAKWPKYAEDPFDAARWIFQYAMKSGPHYLVAQSGRCLQLAREKSVAWHVGSRGGRWYRLPRGMWHNKNTRWWKDRFPKIDSPYKLAGGKLWLGGSCNANTIGIEVVPPIGNPRGKWSSACWDTVTLLTTDLCVRYDIPMAKNRILSHSDCHPRSRSARGQPWDPGYDQWSFEEFKRRLG